MTANISTNRHYGFDLLRILACYMVIQIHTGEFYYIGNGGAVINSPAAHIVGGSIHFSVPVSLCSSCSLATICFQ
jgi:surface polysaccharide O-acyltransferase-like enzyme